MLNGNERCEACGERKADHWRLNQPRFRHAYLAPRPREDKRKAYLQGWSLHTKDNKWAHLVGRVYGHPKFPEGELVTTSPILRLDIPGQTAETMNTIYVLEGRRDG